MDGHVARQFVIVATVARTHPGTQAPTRVSLRLPSTAGPHPTCGPLTRVAIGAARTPLPTTGLSPPARGGIGRGWANWEEVDPDNGGVTRPN